MAQKLILPINKARVTASIDTRAYHSRFGFRHFGTDMISTDGKAIVYASGEGRVAAIGFDDAAGNVVAVVYFDCHNHRTGKAANLTFRYFHLSSIGVKVGQRVNKDTILGRYGTTGRYCGTGAHLHLEADTDTVFPLFTPTVRASNLLRGTLQGAYAFDDPRCTVINPLAVLHYKPTPLDFQSYSTAGDDFIRPEDLQIPKY